MVPGEDLNKLLSAINSLTQVGAVTLKQMRQALANISPETLYSISDIIPADVADSINIQWMSGGVVIRGSDLADLIQATLGYSNSQMVALFRAAALLTP